MNEHILTGLVVIIALGAFSQWLAWRLRAPSILILLIVGFLVGPATNWLDPKTLLGPVTFPLVSIGAAIVLFEGGLTTSWRDIRSVVKPVRRLISIGLLLTWVGISIAASALLELTVELSLLLGAILIVTGPTVVGPLLRHARPRGQVGTILKFEGILNDPIGAALAVLVFQVLEAEQVESALSVVAFGVAKTAVLATLLGVAAAWLYVKLRQIGWLPEFLENALLLPLVLSVYALANLSQHESGLLAVTVMGIALASQRRVSIDANLEFTDHARTLIISVLFVLLTARMELSDISQIPWQAAAFVGVVILVIRPGAVYAATLGTNLSFKERTFLAAMAPRGIVAAATSSVFALRLVNMGYDQATLLLPVTFLVIASCITVYGLGATPLVRWLGLGQNTPQGLLILGANLVARTIAKTVAEHGIRILLVDSDWSKVRKARSQGLAAEHGRLLSDRVLNRLNLDGIGALIALTPNDDTNTLAAAHFRRILGSRNVHQVHASTTTGGTEERESYATNLRGDHFARGKTFEELTSLLHRGAEGRTTLLTESFTLDDYKKTHGNETVPLFALSESKKLRILNGTSGRPQAGERLISLTLPRARTSDPASKRAAKSKRNHTPESTPQSH